MSGSTAAGDQLSSGATQGRKTDHDRSLRNGWSIHKFLTPRHIHVAIAS